MIDWLVEPLRDPSVVRALVASIAVGIMCAVVGCFVVLRGMAFLGDALSHAVLPGVAIGTLLGDGRPQAVFAGALVAAVASALAMGQLARRSGLKQDAAIGIIFSGMFALGIVMLSTRRGYAFDLHHILFGDVLSVSDGDVALIAGLSTTVVLVVIALHREFALISFDPVLGATLRLPAQRIEAVLLALVALTIVLAMKVVGVALTVAMLVTPASAAFMVARRLPSMIMIGALIGALSGVIGIYGAYHLGQNQGLPIATGAAIVLAGTILFGVIALVARSPLARLVGLRTDRRPHDQTAPPAA